MLVEPIGTMKSLKTFRCPFCHRYYHNFDYFQRHKKRHKTVFLKGTLKNNRKCLKNSVTAFSSSILPYRDDSQKKSHERCSSHKCYYCSVTVDDEHSLQIHLISEHCCMYCRLYLPRDQLKSHMNEHHRCEHCKNIFDISSLESHIDSVHKCNLCINEFFPNSTLHLTTDHHIQLEYKPEYYERNCKTCKIMFPTHCSRNWHYLKWHNADFKHRYACGRRDHNIETDNCYIELDSNIEIGTIQELLDHELRYMHCVLCKTRFKSQEDIKTHWLDREKDGVPEYNDAISFSDLRQHINLKHSGDIEKINSWTTPPCNTPCEDCHCNLNTIAVSKIHVHSKQRCSYCRDTFDCNFSLFQHIELEHSCKICHRHFSSEAMKYHLESDHYCSLCQSHYSDLRAHKLTPHKCPFCIDATLTNHDEIRCHLNKSHRCTYCSNLIPEVLEQHHFEFEHPCCRFCNQHFYIKDFESHCVSVHPCPFCSENVAYAELPAHLEFAHKCSYCSELHNAKQMILHIAEEHKCRICLKYFSKEDFRVHKNIFHKCPCCDDGINYSSFENHMDSKHRCGYCCLFFQGNISEHLSKCNNCCKCLICDHVFIDKTSMLAHVNLTHRQSLSTEQLEEVKKTLGPQLSICNGCCFILSDSECKMNFHRFSPTCRARVYFEKVKCANCETVFETGNITRSETIHKIKLHENMKGHCAFSRTCRIHNVAADLMEHAKNREQGGFFNPQLAWSRCKHCNGKFREKYQLGSHLIQRHEWPCPDCKLTFKWVQELKQHREIIHMCTICDEELCSKETKEKHMQKKHKSMIGVEESDTKLSKCGFCSKDLTHKTLMNHCSSEHKCHHCNIYYGLGELQRHIKLKHQCPYCRLEFGNLFMHMVSEHKCWYCARCFQAKEFLLAHVFSEHLCYNCCLNLRHNDSDESIVLILESKVSYKCSHCLAYFPESLIRCFVNSKPICDFCVEVLSRSYNRIQGKVRCEYADCPVVIAEDQLVEHKRVVHKCADCPKFFSCEEKRRTHFQMQHTLKPQQYMALQDSTGHKRLKLLDSLQLEGHSKGLKKYPVNKVVCPNPAGMRARHNPVHPVQLAKAESLSKIVCQSISPVSINSGHQTVHPLPGVLQNQLQQSVSQKPEVKQVLQCTVHQSVSTAPRNYVQQSLNLAPGIHHNPFPLQQSVSQKPEVKQVLQRSVHQSVSTAPRNSVQQSLNLAPGIHQNPFPLQQCVSQKPEVKQVLQRSVHQSVSTAPRNSVQQSLNLAPGIHQNPFPLQQLSIQKPEVKKVVQGTIHQSVSPDLRNYVQQSVNLSPGVFQNPLQQSDCQTPKVKQVQGTVHQSTSPFFKNSEHQSLKLQLVTNPVLQIPLQEPANQQPPNAVTCQSINRQSDFLVFLNTTHQSFNLQKVLNPVLQSPMQQLAKQQPSVAGTIQSTDRQLDIPVSQNSMYQSLNLQRMDSVFQTPLPRLVSVNPVQKVGRENPVTNTIIQQPLQQPVRHNLQQGVDAVLQSPVQQSARQQAVIDSTLQNTVAQSDCLVSQNAIDHSLDLQPGGNSVLQSLLRQSANKVIQQVVQQSARSNSDRQSCYNMKPSVNLVPQSPVHKTLKAILQNPLQQTAKQQSTIPITRPSTVSQSDFPPVPQKFIHQSANQQAGVNLGIQNPVLQLLNRNPVHKTGGEKQAGLPVFLIPVDISIKEKGDEKVVLLSSGKQSVSQISGHLSTTCSQNTIAKPWPAQLTQIHGSGKGELALNADLQGSRQLSASQIPDHQSHSQNSAVSPWPVPLTQVHGSVNEKVAVNSVLQNTLQQSVSHMPDHQSPSQDSTVSPWPVRLTQVHGSVNEKLAVNSVLQNTLQQSVSHMPDHQSPSQDSTVSPWPVRLTQVHGSVNEKVAVNSVLQNTLQQSVSHMPDHQSPSQDSTVSPWPVRLTQVQGTVKEKETVNAGLLSSIRQNPVQQIDRGKPVVNKNVQQSVSRITARPSLNKNPQVNPMAIRLNNAVLHGPAQQSASQKVQSRDQPPIKEKASQNTVRLKTVQHSLCHNPDHQAVQEKPVVNSDLQQPSVNQKAPVDPVVKNSGDQTIQGKPVVNTDLRQPSVNRKATLSLVVEKSCDQIVQGKTLMKTVVLVVKYPGDCQAVNFKQKLLDVPALISGLEKKIDQHFKKASLYFKCGRIDCNIIVKTKCQLMWHLQRKHSVHFIVKCGYCNEELFTEGDMVKHELLKQHCIYCKEAFDCKQELMAHWGDRQKVVKNDLSKATVCLL
ncbi:uncharacterized protein [Amphiura filiformis]|uniref:uncharacterized protein n=1 Tax=Amphiura filiformis TaxID=82378 RepID=UPI003B222551